MAICRLYPIRPLPWTSWLGKGWIKHGARSLVAIPGAIVERRRLARSLLAIALLLATCLAARAADRAIFDEAVARVKSFRADHGAPPTVDDYFSMIADADFTNPQQSELWWEVCQQQEPLISLEELVAILEAKRDSIASFRCEYTYEDEEQGSASSHVYAFDKKNGIRIEESPASSKTRKIMTYDGDVVRRAFFREDKEVESSIGPLDSLSIFFKGTMPLCLSMMFDSSSVANFPHSGVELAAHIDDNQLRVFETTEEIDGRTCLVLANRNSKVWLDIDRNFALVKYTYRFTEHVTPKGADLQVISGRWLQRRKVASDFEDYGNGIWLPNDFKIVFYDKAGEETGYQHVTVQAIEINPTFEDAYFAGSVIPDGSIIHDGVRGMIYPKGEDVSIGGLLEEAVPTKKTSFLRWVSVCAGLVLIGLVILWLVMKVYRRGKGL
jgi:hypothetical protein